MDHGWKRPKDRKKERVLILAEQKKCYDCGAKVRLDPKDPLLGIPNYRCLCRRCTRKSDCV